MKKKILSIACVLVSVMTFAQVPTDGLVAHYPFNGNANDESTNSNHGTVNGAMLTTDRFGNVNSAYSFDGVDDYMEISNALLSSTKTSYSLSAWVSVADFHPTESSTILSERYGAGSYSYKYHFSVNDDTIPAIAMFNGPNNSCSATRRLTASTWYHIVGAYDASTEELIIYIDGIAEDSLINSAGWYSGSNPTQIGRMMGGSNNTTGLNFFNGKIDDIRIYNQLISPIDVEELFNEGKCTNVVNVIKEDTLNIYLSSIITTVYDPSQAVTTVKVYPNPTDENLTVSIDNYTNLSGVTLKVINSQSAEVHSEAVTGPTQSIDVSSWSAGIYFLQVLNGTDIVDIRKIVVNN